MKKNNKPSTQVRLEAKRLFWEKKAMFAQSRLQNNLELVKGSGGKLLTNEVLDKLYTKVPNARALIKWVAPDYGKAPKTELKVIHHNEDLYNEDGTNTKKSGLAKKVMKMLPMAGNVAKPFASKFIKKTAFRWSMVGARALLLMPFKGKVKGSKRRKK